MLCLFAATINSGGMPHVAVQQSPKADNLVDDRGPDV
jgi:hypothetical protein